MLIGSLRRSAVKSFIPSHRSLNITRYMASVHDSIPHEIRTAAEPRENVLEPVVLTNVREVNDSIRLFRLNAADPNHTIQASASEPSLRDSG